MYVNVFVLAQLMLQYDMHRFNKYSRVKKTTTSEQLFFSDAKGFMIFFFTFTRHVVFPGQFIIIIMHYALVTWSFSILLRKQFCIIIIIIISANSEEIPLMCFGNIMLVTKVSKLAFSYNLTS